MSGVLNGATVVIIKFELNAVIRKKIASNDLHTIRKYEVKSLHLVMTSLDRFLSVVFFVAPISPVSKIYDINYFLDQLAHQLLQ